MALGSRKVEQVPLFLTVEDLPQVPTTPFFDKLNEVLAAADFDGFAAEVCAPFYHSSLGRPSLPPGVYFRLLLLGHLMGLDSERRIALQVCDSLSLRRFLGYALHARTPDHSTLAKTRRRLTLAAHEQVFAWVLERLRAAGLAAGAQVAVDATTLQANAALRGLQRKDSGAGYQEFVRQLAQEAGEPSESVEEVVRFDRTRKGKKLSNADWESPTDRDARIAQMNDGTTHLAYKAEHAVDLDSGALVAVTVQAADLRDTQSLPQTLAAVADAAPEEPATAEIVLDKGYPSDATLERLEADGVESYVPEPQRPQRNWKNKPEAERRHGEDVRWFLEALGDLTRALRTVLAVADRASCGACLFRFGPSSPSRRGRDPLSGQARARRGDGMMISN